MMVVDGRRAGDEAVAATREVDLLDEAELGEDFQRSEDRGSANPEPGAGGLSDEVTRGEVAVVGRDERGESPAGLGEAVAGSLECVDDRLGLNHQRDDSDIETESQ